MPRSYVRTTSRGGWSQESMQQAMVALGEGKPLNTCATQFGVPRNTLRRHWLKTIRKSPGSSHLGRESILGPRVEKDLVEYILLLEDRGFGLTPCDVRELAFEYAERNNIPHTFDRKLKTGGLDWWSGFRHRHRELLSIRKPEALSLARASAMNKPAITKYFNILEKEIKRLGLSNKPTCVYNCDESGLSLVPDTCKVVARRGKKNVYQVTSAERGVLTTVLPCYNAAGYYMPPMIIYKGKRLSDGLRNDMPSGTLIAMSDTGYMNMDLFQMWLEHFKKNLQEPHSPALLILDGHGSHVKAINALKYAEENNISIICLPPHTTHWTQPLDRSFFKPLKSNYAHECRKFMRDNSGKVITRYNFGKLFSAAYLKTASLGIAVDSFRATGIYPLNRAIFPDDVFAPSQTTDRELPPSSTPSTVVQSEATVMTNDAHVQSTELNRTTEIQTDQSPNLNQDTLVQSDMLVPTAFVIVGGIAQCDGPSVTENRQPDGPSVTDNGQPKPVSDEQSQSAEVTEGDENASRGVLHLIEVNQFEVMRPLPKKVFGDNKGKRKSRATSSRVLTSHSHIANLEKDLNLFALKQKKRKSDLQLKVTESRPKHRRVCPGSGTKDNQKGKKLTIREDKPRGRRPNNQNKQRQANIRSVKKSKSNTVCCAGCGEMEDESMEDWIACIKCHTWYELSCAGVIGKPKHIQDSFMCGDCEQ